MFWQIFWLLTFENNVWLLVEKVGIKLKVKVVLGKMSFVHNEEKSFCLLDSKCFPFLVYKKKWLVHGFFLFFLENDFCYHKHTYVQIFEWATVYPKNTRCPFEASVSTRKSSKLLVCRQAYNGLYYSIGIDFFNGVGLTFLEK